MKKHLTVREKKVLTFIKNFQAEMGEYPTYREILGCLKLQSLNSVTQYVRQLNRKGCLEMLKNRGFRLPSFDRPSFVRLPLLGSIQAGNPNFTQETEEKMFVPLDLVPSPQRSYLLKVKGNSMENAGIMDGDLVIVDQEKKESSGDIVVALVDQETTVKRLQKKEGKSYLKAESREHSDIHPKGSWSIQGVVVGLWRQYA